MKKIGILIILLLLIVTGCAGKSNKTNKIKIVTTNFPSYDFVRAVTKNDNVELKMLTKPGEDLHHYEPSPKDIIDINESDLFIYIGGESDVWVNKILKSVDNKNLKTLKLIDFVTTYKEELVEGMQEEHNHEHKHDDKHKHDHDHEKEQEHEHEEEIDEHIWTSPINAIKLINVIKDEIVKIDKTNKNVYEKNASEYIKKLEKIDSEIKEVVKNKKRDTLVFGDRFPLVYFTKQYNLKYYAAFPGCSHENEASSKTIAFLIDKVKANKIPVVLHLELSNKKTATLISKDTNAKMLEFNSGHNVTNDEFKKGITYVDLMTKNIEVLKEALN